MRNEAFGSPMRFSTERERLSLLRVPRPIDVVQVQATATTIFTARADADFHIQVLIATNVTATDDFLTLHLVPDGDSASISNTIGFEQNIAGKSFSRIVTLDAPILLQPGAALVGLTGTDDAVNVYGWGYDYQGEYSV